jgi:hypothetical protein
VLGCVEGVDVVIPMAKGVCAWGYERERVVGLLGRFTGLKRLYVRTGEVLSGEVVGEVQRVLTGCCARDIPGGRLLRHYWWWYSTKNQEDARRSAEEKRTSMSGCRVVRLFERNKRRLRLILPDQDIRHQRVAQYISSPSRLTYLFLLD